jgi:8-hydroxy-5-deazaflavin:NADPH oxidoreductase
LADSGSQLGTIAVIGGTGKEGSGLALRWANAGCSVIIGSREAEKAQASAAELNQQLGREALRGMANEDAAKQAGLIVLTVPYSAHQSTLESLHEAVQGKVLVDVTVPMQPPVTQVHLPPGGSAAQEAQALLGANVRVVSAFQNVSAVHLKKLGESVHCDVLITGDDADAKEQVVKLAEAAGMRGIDAGLLANAVAAESLTSVLLYMNKRYGVKGAGIHITQLDGESNQA